MVAGDGVVVGVAVGVVVGVDVAVVGVVVAVVGVFVVLILVAWETQWDFLLLCFGNIPEKSELEERKRIQRIMIVLATNSTITLATV